MKLYFIGRSESLCTSARLQEKFSLPGALRVELELCKDEHGLSLVGEGTVGSGLLFKPTAHPRLQNTRLHKPAIPIIHCSLKFSKTFQKWKISMDHGPHESGAIIY